MCISVIGYVKQSFWAQGKKSVFGKYDMHLLSEQNFGCIISEACFHTCTQETLLMGRN